MDEEAAHEIQCRDLNRIDTQARSARAGTDFGRNFYKLDFLHTCACSTGRISGVAHGLSSPMPEHKFTYPLNGDVNSKLTRLTHVRRSPEYGCDKPAAWYDWFEKCHLTHVALER